jgi:glucose-6-phosphate 1-dehydrogenase
MNWNIRGLLSKILKNYMPAIEFNYPNYDAGINGPKEAIELIRKDGRTWWSRDAD